MSPLLLVFLISAFFLQLKAIEYRGIPTWAPVCSVAAWVCYFVTLLLLILAHRVA